VVTARSEIQVRGWLYLPWPLLTRTFGAEYKPLPPIRATERARSLAVISAVNKTNMKMKSSPLKRNESEYRKCGKPDPKFDASTDANFRD